MFSPQCTNKPKVKINSKLPLKSKLQTIKVLIWIIKHSHISKHETTYKGTSLEKLFGRGF